jgi:peptidoglycan/xylan/chitin deacetylase (PgdA/CDA1 family)
MVRVDLGQPAPASASAPASVAPRADASATPAPPAEATPAPAPAPAPDGDPTPPPDPALAHGDRIEGGEVKGLVAFTFDDGPNVETTPHVIAALQKYDVPATFFIITRRLVGRLAERNREVLAKEVAGGFLIGSHTVSHTNLLTVSAKAIGHEVDQSLRVLSKEAGRAIGLFRPPFGALDDRGQEHLQRRGLTEVKWSIDSLDWRERDGDRLRQRTIAAILKQDGGVVLMHDAKEVTARSLGLLLDDLEAANCRRLAGGKEPILPVSLHYWLRDGGRPRPVPEEVQQRTLAYRSALPGRCAARPAPALEAGPEKQRARRRAPR